MRLRGLPDHAEDDDDRSATIPALRKSGRRMFTRIRSCPTNTEARDVRADREEPINPRAVSLVMGIVDTILHGVALAAGMAWKTGWSLVLGFGVSAVLQSIASTRALRERLGSNRLRPVFVATLAGAASSSCSYASAAIMRSFFKKGAALGPSLAFLVASTNLVLVVLEGRLDAEAGSRSHAPSSDAGMRSAGLDGCSAGFGGTADVS